MLLSLKDVFRGGGDECDADEIEDPEEDGAIPIDKGEAAFMRVMGVVPPEVEVEERESSSLVLLEEEETKDDERQDDDDKEEEVSQDEWSAWLEAILLTS